MQELINPMVSIVVPVYNIEQYLGQCLESLVSQTYCNLEIILVDDGSTDNTKKICEEYAKKYPEYDFKNNKGYGTKDHIEALRKYGPVKGLHRFTYKPVKDAMNVSLFDI